MPPRAAALAGFAVLTAVAWAGVLGPAAYPVTTLAAVAATTLLVLRAPAWAYACALVAWLVATPLLVGLGAPANWPGAMVRGGEVIASGVHPTPVDLPGAVGVVLCATAGFWLAGARAAAAGPRTLALACAAAPWLAAVCVRDGDDAVWEGGVAFALAALWLLGPRDAPARRVAAVAAVVGVGLAALASPDGSWLTLTAGASGKSAQRRFDPAQTYGPLRGRRDGTVLFRARSPWRSYWRMQELDVVDGHGWRTAILPTVRLPEPRARPEAATIETRALRSSDAVGPGRITAVPSGGRYIPFSGGTWRLDETPRRGDAYRVVATSVDVSAAQREHARLPTDPRARNYLAVGATDGAMPSLLGAPRDPDADAALRAHGYARTLALARRLADGAHSEDEVVRRVQAYLADYRYATDAPDRPKPLEAFLFQDRAGSCQHFAGAAALLLRLAGVPARVAVGFAPGERDAHHRWVVRDRDAHAWVEVWYQGLGWVVVDPTPAAAGPSADLAARTALAPLVGFLLLAGWGLVTSRRRARRTGAGLLVRLARRTEDVATLREAARVLARTIGPRTAGLAIEAERARYAGSRETQAPSRCAVIRAVWADRGPIGATVVLAGRALRRPDPATRSATIR